MPYTIYHVIGKKNEKNKTMLGYLTRKFVIPKQADADDAANFRQQ